MVCTLAGRSSLSPLLRPAWLAVTGGLAFASGFALQPAKIGFPAPSIAQDHRTSDVRLRDDSPLRLSHHEIGSMALRSKIGERERNGGPERSVYRSGDRSAAVRRP